MTDLDLDCLRARFNYDPDTGWLIYAKPHPGVGGSRRAGTFKKSTGYREVKMKGRFFLEHRLIWFIVTGAWPDPECDHRNRVRHDNRWNNLREATRAENGLNTKSCGSATGFRGVYRAGARFVAQIKREGRNVHLGTCDTAEEAAALREDAARAVYGEFRYEAVHV